MSVTPHSWNTPPYHNTMSNTSLNTWSVTIPIPVNTAESTICRVGVGSHHFPPIPAVQLNSTAHADTSTSPTTEHQVTPKTIHLPDVGGRSPYTSEVAPSAFAKDASSNGLIVFATRHSHTCRRRGNLKG